MVDIINLVRPNILKLQPYSSARDEFKGQSGVFLDANENPYGTLNRYPDPNHTELRTKISILKNVAVENICLGNGSDEIIDLAIRIFCEPQKDKLIICPPTYGMYEVAAHINNVEVVNIPLLDNFQPDVQSILSTKAKMLFLCSPNNPTGNCIDGIEEIIKKFDGIVFIDEAYIDFCREKSLLKLIDRYDNLIISQTFSKAWGLAGIRVGVAYASKKIIDLLFKIKPPYNINALSQSHLTSALNNTHEYEINLENILIQKNRLINELQKFDFVENIFKSDANFILIKVREADRLYNYLVAQNIVIRNRNTVIPNCLRISIGNESEITQLINAFKSYR